MKLLHEATAALAAFPIEVARLSAWLMFLFVIFVPLERLFPHRRQEIFRKGFAQDVLYYFLSNLIPKLVLVVPLSLAARAAHHFLPLAMYDTVAAMPFGLRVLAGLVVGELGAYWAHRWSHEIPWLWRYHSVHHAAEEMDWIVHTRTHPVDIIFTRLCALIPLYLTGLAQPVSNRMDLAPVLVTIAATIWGFLIHANINWRFGWLEYVVTTPAFHHWHHTNDSSQLTNKNFSPVLPLMDKCFGTFYLPKQSWPQHYGLMSPMETPPIQESEPATNADTIPVTAHL